jgi:hypothetical protein
MRILRILFGLGLGLALAGGCQNYGSRNHCNTDADCPDGEGCDTEGGSNKIDGYCTTLCSTDDACPSQWLCGKRGTDPPSCDEVGSHRDRKGICDLYDGAYGPNTCESP